MASKEGVDGKQKRRRATQLYNLAQKKICTASIGYLTVYANLPMVFYGIWKDSTVLLPSSASFFFFKTCLTSENKLYGKKEAEASS